MRDPRKDTLKDTRTEVAIGIAVIVAFVILCGALWYYSIPIWYYFSLK